MRFGKNLQFMRKMHDAMTQEELAEKMDVSRQTISKWEMGNAYPEIEKAVALSDFFNCTLDELFKGDMDFGSSAYHDIRIEELEPFQYVRYAVISHMPEDDAMTHIGNWAKAQGIAQPDIIGWDFPFVSQEQINVYHMHGYCAACIIPKACNVKDTEVISQPKAKYAAITIDHPFSNPFSLIPNAYKTLLRYIDVNGLKSDPVGEILDCFERVYEKNGVPCMDVYIALNSKFR